jgi:ABC-type glycerol-3-phosphate transport system permease component
MVRVSILPFRPGRGRQPRWPGPRGARGATGPARDTAWHLLSAGAFISIIVPVAVFISMQWYFVRGLLAGGLKG